MGAVNYWAVLASGVAAMVVGAIWYGPLFGKAYGKAMGFGAMSEEKKKEMQKSMGPSYFYQFVASLLTAWVLAVFIGKLGASVSPVKVAVGAWLGFILPLKFGDALWGGKKTLFYLGAGGSLVTMIVMGLILGAWH